ncbi:related to nucleoporin [Cephalotrichum gorgonifer]|uniref:Related to nucleoporin n=1 Tax=Cephalotrichum gorgonifer TaxID=2041049 RepID=A0AAE8SQZ9_9PEZI|nr:related to nucleoporin [Cephalotrichum gorgonifer]
MSFGFGSSASNMANTSSGSSLGPDLEIIQTSALGFRSISGDAKIRLTSPWTSKPSSTTSLLSIAQRRGLVAAAGPDGVVIASTESVRTAFEAPKEGDSDVRGFTPQLKIPLPMHVSQLAFSTDETYLMISAESGGGIAVYDVQALLQGNTQSAFELATNGEALRVLLPNPTPEKAELCAVVTQNGNLHMANLKERALSGSLKSQVSSISWSNKGKQLIAGLADGTIHQLTPEGAAKAEIPKPPELGDYHVSALTWLENNLILSIHTSTSESPPTSVYHIITRQNPTTFTFNKLTDPVDPFGSDDVPHHFILRLKDFPPSLQDLLIVASTACPDVGLLSRSSSPLATDQPVTDAFTTTEMADDSRRATLPMTEDFQNPIPVGCALDLSAKDTVYKPIPTEEIEESPGPVPGYWVLTHEGILCAWWVIYAPSIKDGTTYPGMAALGSSAQAPAQATTPKSAFSKPATIGGTAFGSPTPATPAFGGSSALGSKASPWGTPATPAVTTSTSGAAFGGSSTLGSKASPWGTPTAPVATTTSAGGPAFGGSSALGSKASPWGTPAAPAATASSGGSAFGASSSGPSFGQPSAFGASSNLGAKPSPWATAAATTSAPASGQSGFASLGSASGNSVFGSSSSGAAPSSGFASFANKSGFGSVSGTTGGTSIFGGGKPAGSPFSQSTETKTAFPPPQQSQGSGTGLFGSSTPFKLQSSFKPDPAAKDEDQNRPAKDSGSAFGSSFGKGFSSALGETVRGPPTPPSKEEDMESSEASAPTPQPKSIFSMPSTTPTSTPAPARFSFASATPNRSIFGNASDAKPAQSAFGGGLFGNPAPPKKEDKENAPEAPQIKLMNGKGVIETPLPPESTSRLSYPLGDSSSSAGTQETGRRSPVKVDAAPLPPDFLSTPKAAPKQAAAEDAPLPPDFLGVPSTSKPATKTPVSTPPKPAFDKAKPFGTPEDAPLPPDFISKRPQQPPPVPAVPESDEESGFSEEDQGSEEYQGLEDDHGSEDDHDSDGSAVDVAKELSPSASGLTPQSSFGGIGGSGFMVNKPSHEPGRSLFGEIGRSRGPIFPPPAATQQHSPRSPSPIRPGRPVGLESVRSVSAPGMASHLLGAKKSQGPSSLGMSILGRGPSQEDTLLLQQKQARERREAEETQPLVDEEDDEIQNILAEEVEGTVEINQFIAHTDVAGPAQKSIPAQAEAVYRDINAMIDTLGLNARSVKAFVKGNSEKLYPGRKTKEDLEVADDWVLCELEDLSEIVDVELAGNLEECRVRDVEEKKDECSELSRNISRLRAKQNDLGLMLARFDPDQAEAMRHMPLSAEQAAQQSDLRRDFAKFSKLLSEAEEAVTLLKTRIASAGSSSGKGHQTPTVEAVMRTINKMTNMVEKRSGDVDVLENQMRQLRMSSAVSREGTPLSPRTPKRSSVFSESIAASGTPRNFRNSLTASPFRASTSTPTRKKISGFSAEEKRDLMDKRKKKLEMLEKLKGRVEEKGVTVWTMDEAE